MKIMNALLYFILCLSSFELNAQSIPIAPEAPQYPLPQTPKPHVIKESKYTKEAKDNRESQKRLIMHDAMIFFDVSEREPGAITKDFSIAMCQNGYSNIGYPIIATSHIYHAFLTYNSDIVQKALPATLARFDIYKTVTEDFYVLIPKTYLKQAEQSYSDKEKEQLQKVAAAKGFTLTDFLTGFALSKLIKVTDPAQKNIKVVGSIDVESLKSVFLKKKDIEQKNVVKEDNGDPASSPAADKRFISKSNDNELLGMWNFVLDGHGYYSSQLRDRINQGMLPGQMKQLKEDQFADAIIAGLKLNQYRDLLKFFIQNINTHFLYYGSCYAGGYNTILGYVDALINNKGNLVSRAKPNFIIAAGALTDSAIWGVGKDHVENCYVCTLKSEKEQAPLDQCLDVESMNYGNVNYVNFFSLLHTYARNDRLSGTLFNDEQLRNILSKITVKTEILFQNFPQVMVPETDIFRAVDISGKISVITNSLVKAHALETEDKKPIIVDDKHYILVYPLDIPVEMNIVNPKKVPVILSMPPTISLQKFEKINFNSLNFKDFLISLSSLAPAFDKYIYIKNLTLMNDKYGIPSVVGSVTLKNVLINIKDNSFNMFYCDENDNVYQNHFIKSKSDAAYASLSKLPYQFFHVFNNENQFLEALVNYFSYPQSRREFSYDTIFVKLISPDEARTIETLMEEDIDAFRSSGLNEKISVITNSLVKTHALEAEDKKPIIIKDKDLIVVYPLEIPVELNISAKKAPRIISMPATISLQKFEKINFNSLTFKDFLISISSLALKFDKYIYIKSLTVTNDEYGIPLVVGSVTLKNVLINIKKYLLRMIYCDEKGNVYETFFIPGQPKSSSKLLYPFFHVFKNENQFLDTMLNYFSYPQIREEFSYDAIFVRLLPPNEVRAIETAMEDIDAFRSSEVNEKMSVITNSLVKTHALKTKETAAQKAAHDFQP